MQTSSPTFQSWGKNWLTLQLRGPHPWSKVTLQVTPHLEPRTLWSKVTLQLRDPHLEPSTPWSNDNHVAEGTTDRAAPAPHVHLRRAAGKQTTQP